MHDVCTVISIHLFSPATWFRSKDVLMKYSFARFLGELYFFLHSLMLNFVIMKQLSIILPLWFRITGMMDPHHEKIDASESTYLPCFPLVFVSFALVADRGLLLILFACFGMQNLGRTKIGCSESQYPSMYFMVLLTRTMAFRWYQRFFWILNLERIARHSTPQRVSILLGFLLCSRGPWRFADASYMFWLVKSGTNRTKLDSSVRKYPSEYFVVLLTRTMAFRSCSFLFWI
jgi:hypothetical protein